MNSRALFRRLSQILAGAYCRSLRHRLWVIATVFLIFAALVPSVRKIRTVISQRDLFETDFVESRHLSDVEKNYETGNSVLLLLSPPKGQGFRGSDLCQVHQWLVRQRLDNVEIEAIRSPFEIRQVKAEGNRLLYPRFFEPDCTSAASTVTPPLAGTPWHDLFTDRADRDLAVEIIFRDTPGGSRLGRFDPKPIGTFMQDFETAFAKEKSAFQYRWVGIALFDHFMHQGIQRYRIINLAVILLLLFFSRAFFGTWRSGAMFILTLLLTAGILFGLMSLVGHPADILTNSLFLMTCVAAVQDFVYVSCHQIQNGNKSWKLSFRRLVVPSFFTSLTTAIGFGSLMSSSLSMIGRFGFWAATAALLEWAMMYLFLPAMLQTFPRMQAWVRPEKIWFRSAFKLARFRAPLGRDFTWGLIGVTGVLAVFSLQRLNYSDQPEGLLPRAHVLRQNIGYLRQSHGWSASYNLVFPVGWTAAERKPVVDQAFAHSGAVVVESEFALKDYYKKGQPPLVAELLDREVEASGLLQKFRGKDGSARAVLYAKTDDFDAIEKFHNEVQGSCAQPPRGLDPCYVVGPLSAFREFILETSKTLVSSLLLSVTLVSLVLLFLVRARGMGSGLSLLAASFWGPLAMIVIVALTRVPVNSFTSTCATVLVGLTGDNAIQFLCGGRRGDLRTGLAERGDGAVITALIMCFCCLLFFGSYFQPPRVLGLLLFLGFTLSLFGDYWLLQGLVGPHSQKPRS